MPRPRRSAQHVACTDGHKETINRAAVFRVEKGNSKENKIVVPVLLGRKGKILKCFNADAHAVSEGWVLEVEAGRAVDNNQFLKDIFQACMMHDVLHLAIAVRNTYRSSDDLAKVENFLETLDVS